MIAREKLYDYDYYMSLPEGTRAELINGQIYNMVAAPSRKHQHISGFLYREISAYLKGKQCEVYAAPFDVYLLEDEQDITECKTIVQPDLTVICDRKKLHKKGCKGTPDFIVEIVSPSSRRMDYIQKLYLYSEYKIQEYWVVDAVEETIHVYFLQENDLILKIYSFDDCVKVNIFKDLIIDFKEFGYQED